MKRHLSVKTFRLKLGVSTSTYPVEIHLMLECLYLLELLKGDPTMGCCRIAENEQFVI